MQFLSILFILVAATNAVDIELFDSTDYKGNSDIVQGIVRCTNVPRSFNDDALSFRFLSSEKCVQIYYDDCCQGRSEILVQDTPDLNSINFGLKLTSLSPCSGTGVSPFPSFMEETWLDHTQRVTMVWNSTDLAIYYNDDTPRDSIQQHANYLQRLWSYVKGVYGSFGPEGSRLHPVFHSNVNGPPFTFNSLQTYFDDSSKCRNLIDVVGGSRDYWQDFSGVKLDIVTHEVSHIVEGASKGVHGSPSYQLWGDSKWAEIFIYDVYKSLGMMSERDRWFNQMQDSKGPFDSYWFRDWFYQIYQEYGESAVLNNYFEILAAHFPRDSDFPWRYSRDINLGECVHFWSGAAGMDLKDLAIKAFPWDQEKEGQLQNAKIEFPRIQY